MIALTVDGIGMGENGALWGGECLRVNYRNAQHLGGLPVGAAGERSAAKQPWRICWRSAACAGLADYPETAGLQQQN